MGVVITLLFTSAGALTRLSPASPAPYAHPTLAASTSVQASAVEPDQPSKRALLVLCTVPVALGSFNTAFQLAGDLSRLQAMLLQLCTYAVACCGVVACRLGTEASMRVSATCWRAGIEVRLHHSQPCPTP